MPKFEIKATELQGTDVNFVSLVKRGANRIPFRLTKGDENMLDLHKIGRSFFKSEAQKPEIIGAVVAKGVDMNEVANVFKSAGLDPKDFKKSEDGGHITVTKSDADVRNSHVLKVSDEVLLVVSNIKKAFTADDGGSDDFNAVNSAGGHHLSMMAAHDALGRSISNALANSKSPDEAKSKIEAACEAHKQHVGKLTANLPSHAFKAELGLRALKACGTGNANGGTDDDQETGPDGKLKKADAGKNGTGAGFEGGDGTETNPRASEDDKKNTEVDAKPGARVSGDSSGMPSKAMAKKAEGMWHGEGGSDVDNPPKGTTRRNMFNTDADDDGDDDTVMTGESHAGEGAAEPPTDSQQAAARATADDRNTPATQGQPGGATLDMDGVPAKAKSPTAKNDGDADVGQKGKGNQLPDDQSGAGAQQKDVQTLKAEDILAAIAGLKKSVDGAIAAVAQKVDTLAGRVDGLDDKVQKADAALHGTVFADAGDDQPVRSYKSDSAPAGGLPLIDTGFSRNRAA